MNAGNTNPKIEFRTSVGIKSCTRLARRFAVVLRKRRTVLMLTADVFVGGKQRMSCLWSENYLANPIKPKSLDEKLQP